MKKLIFLLILLLGVNAHAAAPTRSFTYTPNTTIVASQVTTNEDNLYNYLQAGVDVIADGAIVNADISASAGIPYSKLTLTGLIVNTDIGSSAAIAYSKLNLTGAILNADLAGSIEDSKLNEITSNDKVNFTALNVASETANDMVYFNGTNWTRLAAGSANTLLSMSSTGTTIEWGGSVATNEDVAFQARMDTATQSTSNGTAVKIDWDAENFDTGSDFDIATNDRFEVPLDGKYFINLRVTYAGHTSITSGEIFLKVNGSTNWYLQRLILNNAAWTSGAQTINGAEILDLSSGDYVEAWVEISGANSTITGGGSNETNFSGFRLTD